MKKGAGLVFLCCLLALPTAAVLSGAVPAGSLAGDALRPWLAAGTLLGIAHLILRPILRLITFPLGCLTMGLFGWVIDIGLIYGCAYCIEGYTVPDFLTAVITAALINAVNAVTNQKE